MDGNAKFKNHIIVIQVTIINSLAFTKLNSQTATLPFTKTSNTKTVGIMETNRYILEINVKASM